MREKIVSIFIFLYFIENSIFPQESLNKNISKNITKGKLTIFIISGTVVYAGGFFYLNYMEHKGDERVPFHFYNDNKGYLQIDKFQHAYGSYIESYIGYNLLKTAGFNKNKAILFGGTIGLFLQTPKEILDGLYKHDGFSWGDVLANAAGSSLLISQELLFNEQVVKYKFSFSRSRYAKLANGYLGKTWLESYSKDYNGHTYWLSINANKIFLRKTLPAWINLAAGYSADGMIGPFKNIDSYNGITIPETQRYRQFLLSLDIDWSKINTRSRFLKVLFQGMNFIKIPFPAVEINSRGRLKGYCVYF